MDHHLQPAAVNNRILVQKEEMTAAGMLGGPVIPFGKAQVSLKAQDLHRKVSGHPLGGAVTGRVVRIEDLILVGREALIQDGTQTALQQAQAVVSQDDDTGERRVAYGRYRMARTSGGNDHGLSLER
jgi:hypothetical protein